MSTWLTLTEAAKRIQGDAALASAERRIRRWVESGDLKPLAGRFRAADVLATEKKMRSRRGRPRKTPDARERAS
ncbi:hypothetical protein [Microbacterium sp. NPDC087592]|uniref:hypothetical protein n=1 Tax=Microbacterium sp. NPDC087592 TaxID=3364193 RepID=UPI0037F30000